MTDNILLMLHPADPERPGSPLHLIDILLPPDDDYRLSCGQKNEQAPNSAHGSVEFIWKCNQVVDVAEKYSICN